MSNGCNRRLYTARITFPECQCTVRAEVQMCGKVLPKMSMNSEPSDRTWKVTRNKNAHNKWPVDKQIPIVSARKLPAHIRCPNNTTNVSFELPMDKSVIKVYLNKDRLMLRIITDKKKTLSETTHLRALIYLC